jgi:hypothetical protein
LAFLKPTNKNENHPRAAYEKIASDIAAFVDVRVVPPVVLYHRPGDHHDEHYTCLSLVLFPQVHEWNSLAEIGELDPFSALIRQGSGVIALDTYLRNTDRSNGRNCLIGQDPDNPEDDSCMFIDYSNSMNFDGQWSDGKWAQMQPPTTHEHLKRYGDPAVINAVATNIESLPDAFLKATVERVPDEYLNKDAKSTLLKALLERRGLVRQAALDSLA